MSQRIYLLLIAVAMTVVTASLSGCGSTETGLATVGQTSATKADVTISARFPASGEVVKSLLPAGTQVIEVIASQPGTQNIPVLIATLTAAAPTITVKMGSGMYMIYATAYDSTATTRNILGRTATGGEVQVGVTNNVNLTFLDGQWTLVDASDTPSPIVLSNGTQLVDFIIAGGGGAQATVAVKSSIDYSKPFGGGSGLVRLRFDNNTSARTQGGFVSQFVGSSNSSTLSSGSYNISKKCGFDSYYGLPCVDGAGDQIVMIGGKDDGASSSYDGTILTGSAETLLANGGKSSFTQNGAAFDLMAALPATTITSGSVITGGIVEWKPSTDKTTVLGTLTLPKVTMSAKTVNAQSANIPYTNIAVKESRAIVCSGTNPRNRGSWSFASYTSVGKVLLGGRVCYTNYPQLNGYPVVNSGDYSYGLLPSGSSLGDYCQQWDYTNNTCLQQLPATGDIYQPWNFRAVKSSVKTSINYGSFKFNFWGESTQSGSAYIYPFRAKGSTTIKSAPAAPIITSISVPALIPTGTTTTTLTASAFDPNSDSVTWSWSIVSGGGTLGTGCSGTGTGTISSTCAYTPPTAATSVVLKFSASDGLKVNTLSRTLSVSEGTSVVIQ